MTTQTLNVDEFFKKSYSQLIIDVRSPIEYQRGHIISAINIPLFEDAERAEVGTLYKMQGKDTAVTRGLEIVSPKMLQLIESVKSNLKDNKQVFLYCFRGGMRSQSVAWLLNTVGLQTTLLNGGYKAFRNYVLNDFFKPRNFILIGGSTGSGKTKILQHLQMQNIQILNLEKIAHHKGSAFGAINENKQPSQPLFENEIYSTLNTLDATKPILIEDEAQTIGFNKIPIGLWLQMKRGVVLKIEIPLQDRINNILQDYGMAFINELKNSILKIEKKLGAQNSQQCLKLLDGGNLKEVIEITLSYYDKTYNYNFVKNKNQTVTELNFENFDLEVISKKIKNHLKL